MLRSVLVSARLLAALLGLAAASAAAPGLEAASFPPDLRFRSVSTPRVTVHFHQGLESTAREAASLATEILDAQTARYGVRLGRVQIVLADSSDDPNGFASPLPYPLVQLRAAAPDGGDEFGNYESWLRLVLTHELAHVVHLEQSRGLFGAGRKVFGRAPFLFPNALTPTWTVEGLATFEETEGTAFGRGRNPDSRMVLRMAALDDEFPAEDRPVRGLDRWPGGQAAYLFGESFLRDLTDRFGESLLPDLARVHSGRVIPFLDEFTSRKVTGAGFNVRWREWAGQARLDFVAEAERIARRGLTESRALTSRGVRQGGARFSPDGAWIAYTSRSLTRYPCIRVMRADGADDRKLVDRNGGSSLSWTPDGRTLVYDTREVHRTFASHADLLAVDVASGRVRRLTRGQRVRDADVAPDGRTLVCVRRLDDRSELYTLGLDGGPLRPLTRSEPGTEFNAPHWSPGGDAVVASRFLPGGWLDLVIVDRATGEVRELTRDRAKDVEPVWTPDGTHVVFRSDRDGVSNLYAARVSDGTLFRVSNVLGGAFGPDIGRDGRTVVFAAYSSRGYDIHAAVLDLDALEPAAPFVDEYGAARDVPPPAAGPDRPYRPFPALLPRFWSPYVAWLDDELRYGAATGGADPLLRHAYGVAAWRGSETGRWSFQGIYQYDRFRPTFLVTAEDETRPSSSGRFRTQNASVRASFPLRRTPRSSQSVSLAWRRERQGFPDLADQEPFDLGGIEAAWALGTAREYPYSVSPADGARLRVAYLLEDPALGGDVSLRKLTLDGRSYLRAFGESDVLAVRMAGGTTFGRPGFRRSFALGGFPEGGLFDLVDLNPGVLRGYPASVFEGRRFATANLEYRFPLAHPQRGWRTLPAFVRSLHASLFADAGQAWSDEFRLRDVKSAAGAALGADVYLAHALPFTATLGAARGFADRGETQLYFRLGLAF
jgi:Tol biopolymer transport system component